MLPSTNLADAVAKWSAILGPRGITTEHAFLQAAQRATFVVDHRIPAAIFPSTTDEVRQCLLVATEHKVPIYPVSGGKNWGYGSRVPAQTDCVLVDLSRMAAIVDYDDTLGYVVLEPGVSFAQLAAFLNSRKSSFFCATPGTSPDASVVGNVLERGIALGPQAERAAHVCNLEVVLPSGEILRSGLGHFANALAANCWRWSIGPQFDGLFSQSNLGIVTRMTIWLTKKPKAFQTFSFTLEVMPFESYV
jgi:4-cresol dehydrogenase (hydroxylating) flavoprotein subunit